MIKSRHFDMDIISTDDYSGQFRFWAALNKVTDCEMKLIFDYFDKDKDGFLSFSDVKRAFKEILPLTSEEELQSIFKVMLPNNGEQRINFK